MGLAAACDYLDAIGMDAVLAHERALVRLADERLRAHRGRDGVTARAPSERSGVVSFTLADIHPHDLATILDERGVCIRAGHHCAQPLMRRLGVPATARASFYVYNDESDVERSWRGSRARSGCSWGRREEGVTATAETREETETQRKATASRWSLSRWTQGKTSS